MNIIRHLWNAIRAPTAFFQSVAREKPSRSIWAFLIFSLLGAVVALPVTWWALKLDPSFEGIVLPAAFLAVAVELVKRLVGAVIGVLLVHCCVRFLKGAGNVWQTAKAMMYPSAALGMAGIPISIVYAVLLFLLAGSGSPEALGSGAFVGISLLFSVVNLAIGIAALVSMVKGVKILHKMTTGAAVGALLLALAVVLVIALAFVFVLAGLAGDFA